MSLSYSHTTFELSWLTDVAFCKFLFNNVVKHLTICEQKTCQLGYVHTEMTSYHYHSSLIFGTEKLTVFTWVQSIIVPVFGTCSHRYDIVSFQSISSQNEQKKSDMSTNFKHCRIRSINKHEKKVMECFEF